MIKKTDAEDVPIQKDFIGGANKMSLNQARKAYQQIKGRSINLADNMYKCPLLDRKISEGYCYDVDMVAFDYIKPMVIDDVLPEMAAKVCEDCQHTQLTE